MATVGDPLMDLGAALAYWVQADDDEDFQAFRRVPTHLPGMLTRGRDDRRLLPSGSGSTSAARQALFYEAYGLFRLAVIAQQIYYRYANGQTTNEAYAVFGPAVQILDRRLRKLLGLMARPGTVLLQGAPGRGRRSPALSGALAYPWWAWGVRTDIEVRRSRSAAAPSAPTARTGARSCSSPPGSPRPRSSSGSPRCSTAGQG